ncbi:MAG TPA: hypothetical protein VGA66_05350, partial [Mycobacterium sp.]
DCDTHGQLKFNYRHPHIRNGEESEFLLAAFDRDFTVNGPSIVRVARTLLAGWKRYKDHSDARVRDRICWEARDLPVVYAGSLWAAARWFRSVPALSNKITAVLNEIYREFGLKSRLAAPIVGRYIRFMLGREDRRLRSGWTYEPPTFRDLNAAARCITRPANAMGVTQ